MLYCNDELVKVSEPQWEHLKKEFAEIRKMKNPIRIKTTQKKIINPTGFVEIQPAHIWPLQTTVINNHGQSETWVYAKNTPKWENDQLKYSERSILITHGLLMLDPIKETDKVYFLLKLSPLLKNGLYEIENLEENDTKEVNKIGANAAIEYFICNRFSPLYKNIKRTRELAASWGIPNAEITHIDTIRKLLLQKVYASQQNYQITKRGIDEFIAEVNGDDPFSEYRTMIQFAIDKKIIGWNDKEKGWYFMDSNDKSFIQPIIFIPVTQLSQKHFLLFEHIKMNANLFENIRLALDNNKNDENVQDKSDENKANNPYEHLEYRTLRKIASEKGIFEKTDTHEILVNKLIQQATIPSSI